MNQFFIGNNIGNVHFLNKIYLKKISLPYNKIQFLSYIPNYQGMKFHNVIDMGDMLFEDMVDKLGNWFEKSHIYMEECHNSYGYTIGHSKG